MTNRSSSLRNYIPSSGKVRLINLWTNPYLSIVAAFLYVFILIMYTGKELQTQDDFIMPFIGLILFGLSSYNCTQNNPKDKGDTSFLPPFNYIVGALIAGLFIISMIQNIKELSIPYITPNWVRKWILSYVLLSLSIYSLFYISSHLSKIRRFIKIICYTLILFIFLTLPECNEYIYLSFSNYGYYKINWGIILLQTGGLIMSLGILYIINKEPEK